MKKLFCGITLVLLGFLAWPYMAIYQLDQALKTNDHQAIERLVDIQAIQQQVKRKMNKEVTSTIGEVSNGFIDWLQAGIQRLGNDAIEDLVNMDWVISQLRSPNPNPHAGGFLHQLDYAFFDGPHSLMLRIGELGDNPVHARLTLQGTQWRITALYN